MFKTNFSGRNKIWGGAALECSPVATGLDLSTLNKWYQFMLWKNILVFSEL